MRGQALPCTEGATGSSRKIFPKKKKTLWGTLGNSPVATAPVSSPTRHPSGNSAHLISEGAETTGTTRGRVPSNQECAHPPGNAHTSFQRELRLQASPREGCPANGSVCTSSRRDLRLQAQPGAGCPSTRECAHLISEGAETTGTTQGRVSSEWECLHLISEVTDHRNQVECESRKALHAHP